MQYVYKTILFRSYHEWTWARFFTKEGLIWEYEPETFKEGSERYTPDFRINPIYIEIKTYGAKRLNAFHVCSAPLLLIFGKPDRHYSFFKPAGASRFERARFTQWQSAYEKASLSATYEKALT